MFETRRRGEHLAELFGPQDAHVGAVAGQPFPALILVGHGLI